MCLPSKPEWKYTSWHSLQGFGLVLAPKCHSSGSLTKHFQVSLSQEVLHSWVVNDAVHWHSIILFGDRKPHPAGDSKHPVIHLLYSCLTYIQNTRVKESKVNVWKLKTLEFLSSTWRSGCNGQIVIAIKSTLPVKEKYFQMAFTFNLWLSDVVPEQDFRGFRRARGLRFWREQRGAAGSYQTW